MLKNPLILAICAGASIRLHEFQASPPLCWAVYGKLLLVPLLITAGGIGIGLQGIDLGALYLVSAAPTAAATSLGSMLSTTQGIFLLRSYGLI